MDFSGIGTLDNKSYKVSITFLHKINPDKVTNKNTARCIEFVIPKAESGPYWQSLTTDKKKPHFLKVDFNKWVDEENGKCIDSVCVEQSSDIACLQPKKRKL